MTAVLATLLLVGYALACLLVGITGVFGPPWAVDVWVGVPRSALPPMDASLLSQYRFARAMEFGVGLFCIVYRRDILDRTHAHLVFVAICSMGIVARSLSWWIDGRPARLFLAFITYEILTLVFVLVHARRYRG